jgi:hypothetical protein
MGYLGSMNRLYTLILMLALLLCQLATAHAQSQPESSTLVIETQQGAQVRALQVGDRLNYQVKGGQMQRKGKITSVQDSSLTVGSQVLPFASLDVVTHVKGKTQSLGAGLLIGSLIAEPISLLFFVVSLLALLDNPTRGQRVLIGILSAFTIIIFPLVIVLGIVLLALGSKRYDLRTKYRLRKG